MTVFEVSLLTGWRTKRLLEREAGGQCRQTHPLLRVPSSVASVLAVCFSFGPNCGPGCVEMLVLQNELVLQGPSWHLPRLQWQGVGALCWAQLGSPCASLGWALHVSLRRAGGWRGAAGLRCLALAGCWREHGCSSPHPLSSFPRPLGWQCFVSNNVLSKSLLVSSLQMSKSVSPEAVGTHPRSKVRGG